MRIYIAGPMTGLPEYNFPAFNAAANELRALDYEVENPADNPTPPCGSWLAYMRMAVVQVAKCDMVVLLPGWEASKGARVEFQLATGLGLSAMPLETFLSDPPEFPREPHASAATT